MKASELRLGNYVKNIFDSVVQVTVIDDTVLWPIPIPLTEEWLIKFGAINSYENWQYTISVGAISLHFRCNIEWYSELGGIYLGSKIRYVHQLQNLYFALTGSELIMKSSDSQTSDNTC